MRVRLFMMMAILMMAVSGKAWAGDGDSYFTVNAGFLFKSTLNASFGYERSVGYNDGVEFFGEVGDQWQRDPVCGKVCKDVFWKNHYWDGGVLYKGNLKKFKNSQFRFRIGPTFGAYKGDYFFGLEGGFEYNYVFNSGLQFSVIQKNNVSFLHGDVFRNGLLVGLKVPF